MSILDEKKTLADQLADSEKSRAILERQIRETLKALAEAEEKLQSEIEARKHIEADLLKARSEAELQPAAPSNEIAPPPPVRRRVPANSETSVIRTMRALQKSHEMLNTRLKEKTDELEKANASLRVELARGRRIEDELFKAQAQLETRMEQRAAALANEIADRRRAEEQTQARNRQQAAVAALGQQALSGAEPAALMQEASALVARTLEVEFCKVLEQLPDENALLLRAGVGWKDGLIGRAKVSTATGSQAGYTLLSAKPVITTDLPSEMRFSASPLLTDHGVVSGVSVIIRGEDRPFGVLGAHTSKPRIFTGDDIHFLESMANILSQAIERQRKEEILRANEEELRLALQFNQAVMANMGEGLYVVDARGIASYINPAGERLLGWPSAELLGRKMHDVTHYKHPDGTPFPADQCPVLQVLQQGIVFDREDVFIRKDGSFFPVAYSSSPIRSDGVAITGLVMVFRDLTGRKKAEEELQRSASWLSNLVATTQDAVLSIDRRGCVKLFNPAAERIFGYTREEILGQKVNLLMAEPYASEHDGYIAQYERTGEARAIGRIRAVLARRKNGQIFPIELSVTEIDVDQDVHYAAFIRDVSDKNQLHAQLMESERLAAIGLTAAKIAHELGNPLNGMSLTMQLLEQRLARASNSVADTQMIATVKRLKSEISRLNQLAGEFRTISRKEKYDFRRLSWSGIIEDVIDLHARHFAQHGVEIVSLVRRDLPGVNIDADRMKQVLLNLMKNAADAMPGGGKITFNGFSTDDAVVLEIADTGTGIPLDVDAFEPFTTTKKTGTGLGLVVVRQVVTAHRGKISYRSRPGEGTIFRIDLPLPD